MTPKQKFIEDLNCNGKIFSWEDYANTYGFKNGESARQYWKEYRKAKGMIEKKKEEFIEAINEHIDLENNINKYEIISLKPLTSNEIKAKFGVDDITTTLSNYWNKERPDGKFLVSAFIKVHTNKIEEKNFQSSFIDFLKTYKPTVNHYSVDKNDSLPDACLLLPQQDQHFDKYDIHGDNNINVRFARAKTAIRKTIDKVSKTNNIDTVIYVVASDQFNSEWTNSTTKGTPQQNILSYHEAFEAICNYEISVLDYLTSFCTVDVIYIRGNHDDYVGWHLAKWLQAYYKDKIRINTISNATKAYSYNDNLIVLNHGDVVKPKELASKIPHLYSKEWSSHNNYYLFTGDKHVSKHEDFNNIHWYQVPQLSTATSKYDDINSYYNVAEQLGFVFEKEGLSSIIRQKI